MLEGCWRVEGGRRTRVGDGERRLVRDGLRARRHLEGLGRVDAHLVPQQHALDRVQARRDDAVQVAELLGAEPVDAAAVCSMGEWLVLPPVHEEGDERRRDAQVASSGRSCCTTAVWLRPAILGSKSSPLAWLSASTKASSSAVATSGSITANVRPALAAASCVMTCTSRQTPPQGTRRVSYQAPATGFRAFRAPRRTFSALLGSQTASTSPCANWRSTSPCASSSTTACSSWKE